MNGPEAGGGTELTLAMLPKSEEIVLLEMAQRFHVDHLEKVMDAAAKGCKDIHAIIDKVVRKHMKETSTFDKDL
jgi:exosome complex component RRP41